MIKWTPTTIKTTADSVAADADSLMEGVDAADSETDVDQTVVATADAALEQMLHLGIQDRITLSMDLAEKLLKM